eukprot:SAG22_NODE_8166_length_677_cov_2.669550_1_plen_94_part_10
MSPYLPSLPRACLPAACLPAPLPLPACRALCLHSQYTAIEHNCTNPVQQYKILKYSTAVASADTVVPAAAPGAAGRAGRTAAPGKYIYNIYIP